MKINKVRSKLHFLKKNCNIVFVLCVLLGFQMALEVKRQ